AVETLVHSTCVVDACVVEDSAVGDLAPVVVFEDGDPLLDRQLLEPEAERPHHVLVRDAEAASGRELACEGSEDLPGPHVEVRRALAGRRAPQEAIAVLLCG